MEKLRNYIIEASFSIRYLKDNIVEMSPQLYLQLALPFGHAGGPKKDEKKVKEFIQILRFDKNPMLSVKMNNEGKLQVGLHDGRHRAAAAAQRGDATIKVDIVRGQKFKRENPDVTDADLAKRVSIEGLLPEI